MRLGLGKENARSLETYKIPDKRRSPLDMAFEGFMTLKTANYFSGISENPTTAATTEEREREFKATLSSVYRLMGQTLPMIYSAQSPHTDSRFQSVVHHNNLGHPGRMAGVICPSWTPE